MSHVPSRSPNRLLTFAVTALLIAIAGLAAPRPANASVALLMEEPYGEFGAFNPTGHAAVYLNHVCAASPTELRPCRPGELGVVISRYHKIHKDDWIAMPLVPYLYGVDDAADAPRWVDKAEVRRIREAYWRAHLTTLAPPAKDGGPPKGEWDQLVGSSFDRRIYGFQADTTTGQDESLIAHFNDRRNIGHFNLLFHNCADFSRVVLDIYYPHAIHRNFVADLGLETPKQVARSLVSYGKKHPEIHMSIFTIEQVPGTVARSHPVDGIAESFVKSKRYLLPLVVLSPEVAGGLAIGYLADGRMKLPKNAAVFEVGDEQKDTGIISQPVSSPRLPLDPAARPI